MPALFLNLNEKSKGGVLTGSFIAVNACERRCYMFVAVIVWMTAKSCRFSLCAFMFPRILLICVSTQGLVLASTLDGYSALGVLKSASHAAHV